MFVGPDADPRGIGGVFVHHGGERAVLAGYLRDYRLTLELKCAGLDAWAMACRSVEPSDLSLLGLVRHLSDAERYWFRQVMAGVDAPPRYRAVPATTTTGPSATPWPTRPLSRWHGTTGGTRLLSPSVSSMKPLTWTSPGPTSAGAAIKGRCPCGRYWSI